MLYENTCSDEMLKILKNIQKDSLFNHYLLVGGTSLALQIGHRKSVDIDLFTLDIQDNQKIIEYINSTYKNIDIINNNENILQIYIEKIKIDFVKAKGKLIKEPICENGIKLCHYEDIAGMKLNVINGVDGRKKAKDYIDIAYLINILSLEKMFDIYKWKYDKTDVYNVKKDLLDVNKINPYEWQEVEMMKNDIFISNIPGIIKDSINEYNKKQGLTVNKSIKSIKDILRK